MIIASTTETAPYTPSWLEGKPNAPVFHLRAGGVIERAQLEAEVSGRYGAGQVYGFELRQALQSGIQTLLAGDPDMARILELEEAEAGELAEAMEQNRDFVPLPAEDLALLKGARTIIAEHWPPLSDLYAQMQRRRELTPILAFRRFCVGWEGPKVAFARGPDGMIPDSVLAKLDPTEMKAAGSRAYAMLYAGDEGNSGPVSVSDAGQPTSTSDVSSKADGKSQAGSGRKTRA